MSAESLWEILSQYSSELSDTLDTAEGFLPTLCVK